MSDTEPTAECPGCGRKWDGDEAESPGSGEHLLPTHHNFMFTREAELAFLRAENERLRENYRYLVEQILELAHQRHKFVGAAEHNGGIPELFARKCPLCLVVCIEKRVLP